MAPRKSKYQQSNPVTNADASAQSESALLNLSVLRKYDPEVIDIVHIAPYAVVYVFSPEVQATGHWEKNGVEGSFFICKLCANHEADERYRVILLNRRGLDNFSLELRYEEQVEFTDELIIFQDESSGDLQVHGLWIFSEPAPSSTAHQPKMVTDTLRYCMERVKLGNEANARALEHASGMAEAGLQDTSAASGHQFSPSEMFGQQRQQDDSWSVQRHSALNGAQAPLPYQQAPTSNPLYSQASLNTFPSNPLRPAFTTTPPSHEPQQPVGGPLGAQQQHLLGLFQRAQFGS